MDYMMALPETRAKAWCEPIRRSAARGEPFGLALCEAEVAALALAQARTLERTGRVEFGDGILPRLIDTFCDSPFIAPATYADTLEALTELFYYFKNEALEQLSDDELLLAMKQGFDGPGQGSIEYLRGTWLENLCRSLRQGEAPEAPAPWQEDPQ